MLRRRLVLFAMVCLAVMTSVAGFAGNAAARSDPNPNKPVVEIVDVTFPAPTMSAQCGFDVSVNVYGTFTAKVLNNGVLRLQFHYDHTFIGPGGTFSVNHTENIRDMTVVLEDGSMVQTIRATGNLLYHTVVPGYGTIGNNSGNETIQFTSVWNETTEEYELVDVQFFDAGPNNELSDEDFQVLCGLLA